MNTIAYLTISWNNTRIKSIKVRNTFTLGENPEADFCYRDSLYLIKRESSSSFLMNGKILSLGEHASVKYNDITFDVIIEKEEVSKYSRQWDKPILFHIGGVGLLSLTFFTLFSSMPPEALSMSEDWSPYNPNYARFFYQKEIEKEDLPIKEIQNIKKSSGEMVNTPSKGSGSSKGIGNKSKGLGGTLSSNNISLQRGYDPTLAARSAGILGILSSQGSFLTPGGSFDIGKEDSEIWGNTNGIVGEDSGLVGYGRFGDGGNGVIGVGNNELRTPGLQIGGNSVSFGTKEKKPPRISIGPVESSNLDRDMVRRIIRAHINEIRSCYNAALSKNPTLEGRVVVQFSILGTGQVSNSIIQESSIQDSTLESCISRAVKRWKFPSGKGISMVSYPFSLNKG